MASSKVGSGSGSGAIVGVKRMSVEQVRAVKEQADLEVNLLQDSLSDIRTATTRTPFGIRVFLSMKTMAEGKDYCERKITLLNINFDQLVEVASKKKNVADKAGVILQAKLKKLASSS